MRRILTSILQTMGAGTLAVLPVALTVAIIIWVANLLEGLIGPRSFVGRTLSSIGLTVVPNDLVAYGLGTAAVFLVLYFVGLLVRSRLQVGFGAALDRIFARVPLIGSIYTLTNRFVAIFDRKEDMDLQSMSPVWCFFGGGDGVAVLALMPSAEPVVIDGSQHFGVLIPTAPIPFGGGLIFVPKEWIRPAPFGVEELTNVYLSMGLTAPQVQAGKPGPRPGAKLARGPAKGGTRPRAGQR